ncbi:MAG: NAD(P)H-binding protein, partial [Ornithinimicrobium sp.]
LGLRTFKARPTVEDVDLQANRNILQQAQESGVSRFVFISVLHGAEIATKAPIIAPREQFVAQLKQSDLNWTVLRPTGAFNDLQEVFRLAQRGWGIVLADGHHRINPVHGADIAQVVVRSLSDPGLQNSEFDFGGPHTYTQAELPQIAADALGAQLRTVHLPLWTITAAAGLLAPFNPNASGFLKFFAVGAGIEQVGTPVGTHSLEDFYAALAQPTPIEARAN